jgi:hypothetical protein
VVSHSGCIRDDDCVVVGGTGTCDCAPSLGECSGDAISRSSLQEAAQFFARFGECKSLSAFLGRSCDCAPATNLRCDQGFCRADSPGCLSVGDAGSDMPLDVTDAEADAG